MKNMSIIANIVAEGVVREPDLEVLTFVDGGHEEVRTYQQLWDNGQRIAKALKSRGIQVGDRVALLMQNHPEFVETMIAGAILGAVLVPIDPRTRGEKLEFMLNDASCLGVVCADYTLPALLECVGAVPSLVFAYVVGDNWVAGNSSSITPVSMSVALAAALPDVELEVMAKDDAAPMQIMYTSGTTGDPKGVIVRHGRFGFVANQGQAVFGYTEQDRPYTGLSLTHGNAQFLTLAPALKMGLRAVISRRFTKSRLWDIVRHYGCTTFSLLGGMVTAIYSEPQRANDADNPVRLVISAGMPAVLWSDFARRFGVDIFEFYGAMEGGMTINPPGVGPVGSCGRAPAVLTAIVVDEEGNKVPPGVPGEIWFRPADGSPAVVDYFNNPQASAAKVEGGWLHTGDVVTMDADGWVFYQHRKGGGIRHNGDFINPGFVEKVVAEHPHVSDVAAYGIPAASGAPGESDIVIAVVPEEPDCFDPQSVFAWCRGRLENNMIPEFIHVMEELPKTATEKVQARFLVEKFKAGLDPIYRESVG
jgi:carnitine-CoA ligase